MIFSVIDSIKDIKTWNDKLKTIEGPKTTVFGARRYTFKECEGSLSFNDLVRKTAEIFKKSSSKTEVKTKEEVLDNLKLLDKTHLKETGCGFFVFIFLKISHFFKSTFGNFLYDRNFIIENLKSTIPVSEINTSTEENIAKDFPHNLDVQKNVVEYKKGVVRTRKILPTQSEMLGDGGCTDGVYDLNVELLKKENENTKFDFFKLTEKEKVLVVKKMNCEKTTFINNGMGIFIKNVNTTETVKNEFALGSEMEHKNLVKSLMLFIKKSLDDSIYKYKIVMEKPLKS